jgi:hypothetical protein
MDQTLVVARTSDVKRQLTAIEVVAGAPAPPSPLSIEQVTGSRLSM